MEPPLFAPDSKVNPVVPDSSSPGLRAPETSLHAIRTHEEWANQLYGESCSRDFTPSIKALLLRMYLEEQRHLRYVQDLFLRRRVKKRNRLFELVELMKLVDRTVPPAQSQSGCDGPVYKSFCSGDGIFHR